MSGGNWYDRNAYIGVALPIFFALFLAMVGFMAFSYGYQSADKNHQSDYERHYKAQADYENCANRSTSKEAVECYKQADKATRENQTTEQDLDAQREMANWAEGMLWTSGIIGSLGIFVTCVGIYYVRETLIEAGKTTSAAIDAVRGERAWMTFGGVDTSPVHNSYVNNILHQNTFFFSISWKNTGRSPAIEAEPVISYCVLAYGADAPFFAVTENRNSEISAAAIGPGELNHTARVFLTDEESNALRLRTKVLFLHSRIQYGTVFEPQMSKRTEVCLRIESNGTRVDSNGNNVPILSTTFVGPQNTAS
jgi:hypothetical protein